MHIGCGCQTEKNSLLPEYHGLSSGQGFPYWGGVNLLPPPAMDAPPPTKFLSPLHQKPTPPTKQQFPNYNTIKTAFLAAVIAPAPFLF